MIAEQRRAGITSEGSFRATILPGLVLSCLAITLRILVATRRDGIEIDGMTYLRNAQALWTDWSAVDVLHPPLYSVLLAPFLGLWSDPEWGARVLSALLGGLWVWPTLWLAGETTSQRVQWSAGLLVAFMPAAVEASTRVLAEATYGLFLTAYLAMLARTLARRSPGLALVTGVLGGLATLARPEGMTYLVLGWGVLVCAWLTLQPGWSLRQAMLALFALSLAWLLVIAPYSALVWRQTGQWHWSGKMGITLAWGESVGQEQPAVFIDRFLTELRPEALPTSLLGYLLTHPLEMLRRIAINLHHLDKYALPALLPSGGLILVGFGLFRLRWSRSSIRPEWLLVAALLPAMGTLLFLASARYLTPLIPVLSLIAAIGLGRMGSPAETDAPDRLSGGARILLALLLVSFIPWIVRPWYRHDAAGVERAAAEWLRREAGSGVVFVGRHPRVSYYAGARELPLGTRRLDILLREGPQAGARFLIVDNINLPDLRPDLLPLVGGDPGGHRELELAHVEEDRSGNRVVIYRLRGAPAAESRSIPASAGRG
jgi:4-amino-4-deoxy-L-arabinose transferase-like glycosyltransferase